MNKEEEMALFQLIGKKLKNSRVVAKLNQTELASRVGLSRTSLVNIEQGKQHPSLVVLWEITKALDIELTYIIPSRSEVSISDQGTQVSDPFIKDHEAPQLLLKFREQTRANKGNEPQETKPN
jgi:transcriptional regulator with XRE-family HTH domain